MIKLIQMIFTVISTFDRRNFLIGQKRKLKVYDLLKRLLGHCHRMACGSARAEDLIVDTSRSKQSVPNRRPMDCNVLGRDEQLAVICLAEIGAAP